MREHPEVRDVLVCGVPDTRWGSRVAALVAVNQGSTATEASVRALGREFLAAYKVPKQVLIVQSHPPQSGRQGGLRVGTRAADRPGRGKCRMTTIGRGDDGTVLEEFRGTTSPTDGSR